MERVIEMFMKDLQHERPDSMPEDVHFTEALVRKVLENYSETGDVVLDPFAGYGTTLVVSEELGRSHVGIELLADRAAVIRERLGSRGRVIEGDARRLDEFALGTIDVCLTSPPYMNEVDHPQNPLSGYRTMDGQYEMYLDELLDVFLAVKRHLRPDGHLVINAANIRSGNTITPLAWDIARMLRKHLAFRCETYLLWDDPLPFISGDYCLVFQKAHEGPAPTH